MRQSGGYCKSLHEGGGISEIRSDGLVKSPMLRCAVSFGTTAYAKVRRSRQCLCALRLDVLTAHPQLEGFAKLLREHPKWMVNVSVLLTREGYVKRMNSPLLSP